MHHLVDRMKKLLILIAVSVSAAAQNRPQFTVVEATIPQMQQALREHRVTSHELVQQYLTRIAMYEDRLNAAMYVNPNAFAEADQLDRERAAGKLRGPLHG
ncbi:MAG: amidase, partial [Candidatus Limnocylindria bacterium]